MKKIMKTILIGCVSLLLAFGFAGCKEDCEHTYDNACDVTCNECGEERTITHTWVEADCDTSKTCSVCGATDGNALGHTWKEADCDTSKTCSVCGATEGDALGHSPEADDGDCTTEVKCTVCDEVTTSAGQHSPEEDDGNCTTAIYCANCDQIVVPAKENHTATASIANCVDHAICDDCGTSFGELDPNNHKDSEPEIRYLDENSHETYYKCCNTVSDTEEHNGKPTCNSYGYCTICEMAYAEPDPDNHASTETYVIGIDDEKHGIYYSCCQTLKEEAGHTVQRSATCNQKASCADCGNEFGAFDPNNHAIPETSIRWISDESHEERYLCCNTVVKTEPHNGKASCMHVAYCTTCGQNHGDYDMTNHESENYTYIDNGDGTYKKVHECGGVMEEAHTFDSKCACGDEIVITKMTLLGEDFAFDETTNTYTKNSIEERVAVTLIFHGKNLKYVTAENVLQMLQINLVASFSFGELSMVYNEASDTLTVTDEFLVGGDMVFKYSNDSGITWENGCVLSTKKILGISVNECDHGNVIANVNAVEGECVTLHITANAGYKLKSLIVKDSSNNDVTVENNQFIMPTSAVTVSAVFICEEECTFVYKPNTNQTTHKKVCSVCDYVEIESEAHSDLEYDYVDNGDGTHERIWKCCNASVSMEHEFSMEKPCVCGAAAIGITGLLFVANEVYTYDKETRTYTVIIPPDKSTANIAVQLIGNSLEYLQSYNDFIKVKELYCDAEEYDEYELGYLINDCGLVLEWIDRTDGVWVEYQVSNDGGENWTKYKVEVKQSYSIIVDEVENGTITVGENKTSTIAGDTITLIATPDAGYQFEAWVITDAEGNSVTVENDQIIMPASAITVRAIFKESA